MDWWLSLGSLAGVLLLAAVAHLLRLGSTDPLDEMTARRAAESDRPGLVVEAVALSMSRRAALVRARDGGLILVKRHGVHLATRLVAALPEVPASGASVMVDAGDRRFGGDRFDAEALARLA